MLVRVVEDGSTSSPHNALNDNLSSRIDIAFHEYEPKQILTYGSDSRYLGEIRQSSSPLLQVQSVVSVNCVNIGKM